MARKHFLVKPATGKKLTEMVVGSYLESGKKEESRARRIGRYFWERETVFEYYGAENR